ncbi:MAG TPA: hypothetical protein VJ715_02860 [Pyrinomonadaceae bacterium]|nr:hypothetical protein [Pyrinomonadaceae bacterium]
MRVKIFVAAIVLASVAGLEGYLRASSAGQTAQVKEVAGYRQWPRINIGLQLIDAASLMG